MQSGIAIDLLSKQQVKIKGLYQHTSKKVAERIQHVALQEKTDLGSRINPASAALRKCAAALVKIRRALNEYERLLTRHKMIKYGTIAASVSTR